MDHRLYETGDIGAPSAILDRNGEVVLSLCKVCGGAEGAMPTDCPEKLLNEQQLEDIYARRIDYRCGEWVAANPICPHPEGDK